MEAADKTTRSAAAARDEAGRTLSRIAVGVDGYPEGRDAVVLGAAIARATSAELMLVAVHPDPLVVLPSEISWKGLEKQAEATLREARDTLAPGARIVVETDFSIPRALHRVVHREHRDLLVMGSSRHAPEGQVRIGKRTRQLLCQFECALAVAPRGMHKHADAQITRVGVGFDGGPESRAALSLAGALALEAGAKLVVRGVVDDRIPAVGWTDIGGALALEDWDDVIEQEVRSLKEEAQSAAKATGADVEVEVLRRRPAEALLKLSGDDDLLVIGSRRWGAAARLMLGSTGEALMHNASCPVIAVPRPQQ